MHDVEKIKVLLVHDHGILHQALCMLFEGMPDMELLDQRNGETVVQLVRQLQPDVMVIDVTMSGTDNIELSRQVLQENPGVKVVALPGKLHMHVLEQALRAGISGFVLKKSGFDEIVCAIRTVHNNRTYMCPKIKDVLANSYLSRMQTDNQPESSLLTETEYEMIRLLALGMTSKEIAMRMYISSKTVDTRRRKIMGKLGIDSLAELTKYAIRMGLTSI